MAHGPRFIVLLVAGFIVGVMLLGGCSNEGNEQDLERLQLGLHCLNENGHSDSVIAEVRQRLLHPNTLNIVSTNIEPATKGTNGRGMVEVSLENLASERESGSSRSLGHWIQMDYTSASKGGFIVYKTVKGRVDHRTCEVVPSLNFMESN